MAIKPWQRYGAEPLKLRVAAILIGCKAASREHFLEWTS
jgi:hypothetical protein